MNRPGEEILPTGSGRCCSRQGDSRSRVDRKTTETQTGGALQKPTPTCYHASRRDAGPGTLDLAALVPLARIELDLHARDFAPQRLDFEAGRLGTQQQLGPGSVLIGRTRGEPRDLSVNIAMARLGGVPSIHQLLLLLAP